MSESFSAAFETKLPNFAFYRSEGRKMGDGLTPLQPRIYNLRHPISLLLANKMSFFVRSAVGQTRTIFARAIAFVLLVGLIQAVTFGSAHSHTPGGTALGAGQTDLSTAQTEYAIPDPYHFQNVRQECLVCLFHQQLFSSVVHTPFVISRSVADISDTNGEKLINYSSSFTSTPIASPSGRAPPRS